MIGFDDLIYSILEGIGTMGKGGMTQQGGNIVPTQGTQANANQSINGTQQPANSYAKTGPATGSTIQPKNSANGQPAQGQQQVMNDTVGDPNNEEFQQMLSNKAIDPNGFNKNLQELASKDVDKFNQFMDFALSQNPK